jgi:hypothetical protein
VEHVEVGDLDVGHDGHGLGAQAQRRADQAAQRLFHAAVAGQAGVHLGRAAHGQHVGGQAGQRVAHHLLPTARGQLQRAQAGHAAFGHQFARRRRQRPARLCAPGVDAQAQVAPARA